MNGLFTRNDPDQVSSLNRGTVQQLTFQNALGVTALESSFLCVEVADQVLQVVSISVFSTGGTKSQTVLIARSAEGEGIPIHHLACIEVVCREDGNWYFALALAINRIDAAPWLDVDVNRFRSGSYISIAYCPCIELVVEKSGDFSRVQVAEVEIEVPGVGRLENRLRTGPVGNG